MDSTTARAHHDAAGMHVAKDLMEALEKAAREQEKARQKRGGPEEQNGQAERRRVRRRHKLRLKQAQLGRSRGGLTSKVHLAADRKCRPLAFVLTAGQAADSPHFMSVLEAVRIRLPVGRPRTRPDAVAADKAYSSRGNRAYLRKRNIKAVIPEKKDQAANRKKKGSRGGRPVSHDTDLYKERNTVERLINKLKAWRGIATRYDKAPESYLAGLHLRATMIWIDDLLKAAD